MAGCWLLVVLTVLSKYGDRKVSSCHLFGVSLYLSLTKLFIGDTWKCFFTLNDAHQRTIRFIAWSHDGNYLASTSFDGTTCIWQQNSCQFEESLREWSVLFSLEGHENEVKCCSWSHEDDFLATCSRDKSVWIWEKIEITSKDHLDDEQEEVLFECASVQTEHNQDVKHVVWHPNLNILASSSFDNSIKLYVSGDEDWNCFAVLSAHESTVWSLDFNASGNRIVSVSADETIKIWQPQCESMTKALTSAKSYSEKCTKWFVIASLSGYHRWPIYDVSWCPITNYIATVGGDNSIHIFKELKEPTGDDDDSCITRYRPVCYKTNAHEQDINSVHWSSSANVFATGSDDCLVCIWKLNNDFS